MASLASFTDRPGVAIAICATVLLITYMVGLIVYRLHYSPVAGFPGPWLAKVTYWYEFYHDVLRRTPAPGQYTFEIQRMHEHYGPIVRINPAELHIADANFYDAVYAGGTKKRDKWPRFTRQFGIPQSTFATVEHDLHRMRRSALNPFLSKGKVRDLQPGIERVLGKLLGRFEEFQESEEVMTVSLAFAALTNDVVMQYAFARNDNRVEAKDFDPSFHDASVVGSTMGHTTKAMPWILTLMQTLPQSITVALDPNMASYVKLQRDIFKQISSIQDSIDSNTDKSNTSSYPTTIFHEILKSDLPAHMKSSTRLWQDGQVTVIAGTLTTAWALSTILYHLLTQPDTLRKLRIELESAIPDPSSLPSLATLENLPYLFAVVAEGLRLSNGVSSRLQRISPNLPLTFTDATGRYTKNPKTYTIPPGTPCSMTGLLIHMSPQYFPDPTAFTPERWLDNPRLDRYLVPFSRGTRQCIGINLAYAEIYLTLAGVFRVYGSKEVRGEGDRGWLELWETSFERDVEIVGDGITPLVRPGSKGIRIKVRKWM